MNKSILSKRELRVKINDFLERKNKEVLNVEDRYDTHPMFNVGNDSLTYRF